MKNEKIRLKRYLKDIRYMNATSCSKNIKTKYNKILHIDRWEKLEPLLNFTYQETLGTRGYEKETEISYIEQFLSKDKFTDCTIEEVVNIKKGTYEFVDNFNLLPFKNSYASFGVNILALSSDIDICEQECIPFNKNKPVIFVHTRKKFTTSSNPIINRNVVIYKPKNV